MPVVPRGKDPHRQAPFRLSYQRDTRFHLKLNVGIARQRLRLCDAGRRAAGFFCIVGRGGLRRPHLEHLAARLEQGQWQPDLRRLEQYQSSFDMGQDEYAESWAWAHFLLHSRLEHRELLQGYLGDLRREGSAEPLSLRLGRMISEPDAALIQYVRHLAAGDRR